METGDSGGLDKDGMRWDGGDRDTPWFGLGLRKVVRLV